MPKEKLDQTDCAQDDGEWRAIRSSIEFLGAMTEQDSAKKEQFCKELARFFGILQEGCQSLSAEERAKCGSDRVAAEIFLQIDVEEKKVILDRLFKYCEVPLHLFTELLAILQRNFPEYILIVPSLQGYELAREIRRFLGMPDLECVYLKGDTQERLLMGEALREASFEGILQDSQRHYSERGGIEKWRHELAQGREISMYHKGINGEEEVLWMQVSISLSPKSAYPEACLENSSGH